MSVNSAETTAELAGRIAADAATVMLGIDNMISGATIATGGSVVACGTTLCLGAAATATTGGAIAVVGIAQTAQGAMGLGGNLALLTGSSGGNSSNSINFGKGLQHGFKLVTLVLQEIGVILLEMHFKMLS